MGDQSGLIWVCLLLLLLQILQKFICLFRFLRVCCFSLQVDMFRLNRVVALMFLLRRWFSKSLLHVASIMCVCYIVCFRTDPDNVVFDVFLFL